MRPAIFLARQNRLSAYVIGLLGSLSGITMEPAFAQQDLLRPGEAFATRFSGTASVDGPDGKPLIVIDPAGTVGSIVDLRAPGQRAAGEHWVSEPQRKFVTARDVGQVFGVVLDAGAPPNIYLASTSAFGLHRSPDNSQWMDGMWGAGGGPGTIYRLDREAGYQPRVFANVALNGRPNGGPGLGNIAFDKWNGQLFVSDLETGMIHQLRAADGADLGVYDHGTQGRANFIDAARGQAGNLPPIAFDPASRPRIADCPTGKFDNSPECWNFAASGRRVWGLAAWKHPMTGETRLYYSVWSSPAFGDATWSAMTDDSDRRNSIWSIRLGPDGGFAGDVRREFLLPDFFTNPETIALSGFSSPVSDIAFPECGGAGVMLLGERGGIRNLGLDSNAPFAAPHEARALQFGLNQQGAWRAIGRYDVGFYNRRLDGEPYVRANCAGGVAFGPGYSPPGVADLSRPDQFVWISGDSLCSVDGPCNNPAESRGAPGSQPQGPQTVSDQQSLEPDDAEVHGLQGMPVNLFSQITPPVNANDAAAGADQAYLIDLDINVDASGAVIPETLLRDDSTKIGDVAIYQICDAPPGGAAQPVAFLYPPQFTHWPVFSHSRAGTHNPQYSHYRHGTHNPKLSHERARSHTRSMTHHRRISRPDVPGPQTPGTPGTPGTQVPGGPNHPAERSHNREISIHRQPQSHNPRVSSDLPTLSHNRKLSHPTERTHNPRVSHTPPGSHNIQLSHRREPSHNPKISHNPPGSHNAELSHRREPSHDPRFSHRPPGSHNVDLSHRREPSHNPQISQHKPEGSHNTELSHRREPSHNPAISHTPPGSHNPRVSNQHPPQRSHNPRASEHKPQGSHNPRLSNVHKPVGSHNVRISGHKPAGSHNRRISNPKPPARIIERKIKVHPPTRSHNPRISSGGGPKPQQMRQVPRQGIGGRGGNPGGFGGRGQFGR